jgi:hypothetical protein
MEHRGTDMWGTGCSHLQFLCLLQLPKTCPSVPCWAFTLPGLFLALPQCHVGTLDFAHPCGPFCLPPEKLLKTRRCVSSSESCKFTPFLDTSLYPFLPPSNILTHNRCSLGEKVSWGQLTPFTFYFSNLHGAMFVFEKWNFHSWKISAATSLHGCGLTACHIPETNAPWVFGQTSFPSFEVESTPFRSLGQGWRLSSGPRGRFSGWELSCCKIHNHIFSVQSL